MVDQLRPLASAIAEGVASLLKAQVSVTDEVGLVLASASPDGRALDSSPWRKPAYLRVPFRANGHQCQVVISEPKDHGETTSPRVASALVQLYITQQLARTRDQSRFDLMNEFVYSILHGLVPDDAQALREGRELGIDLSWPHVVMLLDTEIYVRSSIKPAPKPTLAERSASIRTRIQSIISGVHSCLGPSGDVACAYLESGHVTVLARGVSPYHNGRNGRSDSLPKEGEQQAMAALEATRKKGIELLVYFREEFGRTFHMGIGRQHAGISGLARSYRDATVALSIGRGLRGEANVHALDAETLFAGFTGELSLDTKAQLAAQVLEPLDESPDLLETLKAFFTEDRRMVNTAGKLFIHRNTLDYRLHKIAGLTSLDPWRFDDAMQLRLALSFIDPMAKLNAGREE